MLLEFFQSLQESDRFEKWITTWTVPKRKVEAFDGQHHEEAILNMIRDRPELGKNFPPKPSDQEVFLAGWIRGGFYQTSTNDHIYIEFDEDRAHKKDVNRTVQYLRRLFKQQTGQDCDSIYTPQGEILLRNFPIVISHLKEDVITEKFQDTHEGITYLKNPTTRELMGAIRIHHEFRGCITEENVFLWPAVEATHGTGMIALMKIGEIQRGPVPNPYTYPYEPGERVMFCVLSHNEVFSGDELWQSHMIPVGPIWGSTNPSRDWKDHTFTSPMNPNIPYPETWRNLINGLLRMKPLQEQTAQQAPGFEEWFKGSKVSFRGKPVMAYHGMQPGSFRGNQFEPLTHFGTSKAADERVTGSLRNRVFMNDPPMNPKGHDIWYKDKFPDGDPEQGGSTFPVYLSIKNPLRIRDHGKDHTPHKLALQLHYTLKVIYREELDQLQRVEQEKGEQGLRDAILEILTQKGYDGMVYKNTFEDEGSTSWVIFRSDQVWPCFAPKPAMIREIAPDVRYEP